MKETIIPVAAAIIFNKEGKFLVARRRKEISNGGKWEFPGGKLKPGETPESCLKREIAEEFNVQIEPQRLLQLVNHIYSDRNILLIGYLCELIDGNFKLSDHDRIRWVTKEEFLKIDLSEADIPLAGYLAKQPWPE